MYFLWRSKNWELNKKIFDTSKKATCIFTGGFFILKHIVIVIDKTYI